MLLYVSSEAACGSVSFPRKRGKAGMGDSQHTPGKKKVRRSAPDGTNQHCRGALPLAFNTADKNFPRGGGA